MNVKIQSVKFDADQKLISFIEEKVGKLERFADGIVKSEVILKIDKDHEHGNKVVNINFDIAGADMNSERRAKSFEEAVDLCIDALKKQIEKFKEKSRT